MNELREKIAKTLAGRNHPFWKDWLSDADKILAIPEIQELIRDAEAWRSRPPTILKERLPLEFDIDTAREEY